MPSHDAESRVKSQKREGKRHKKRGHRPTIPHFDLDDDETCSLKVAVMADLGESIELVHTAWAPSLYREAASEADIDVFLADATSGYAQGRWTALPQNAQEEESLQDSLYTILSTILEKLGGTGEYGISREIWNVHKSDLPPHLSEKPFPRLAVRATGPSFEIPERLKEISEKTGYSNIASVFQVYLDEDSWKTSQQVADAGLHCKQIFLSQPNRNFVRALVITETRLRMIHYDRSGFYVTPYIDIHADPRTFIRLVLGLSSTNEPQLGLDNSVQWKVDGKTGRKVEGSLTTIDAEGVNVVYQLEIGNGVFVRPDIRGRGTTGWLATHPTTGQKVLIKDAWRTLGSRVEFEYLEAARGLPGVCQIFSYQDHCANTGDYRPTGFASAAFRQRIKSRVVMEQYGVSLNEFTSRGQAITALRDAIAGYRNLLKKSIIHRDISMHNILLGMRKATRGFRGVLIDFDMAHWLHSPRSELLSSRLVGTRRYQSMALLESGHPSMDVGQLHDHLDDLESFFYVFCNLVCLYEAPGIRNQDMDRRFTSWENDDALLSGGLKKGFLVTELLSTPWWGHAIQTRLRDFRELLRPIIEGKADIYIERLTADARRERFDEFAKKHADIYDDVIKLFDDTLLELDREDAPPASAAAPLAVPSTVLDSPGTTALSSSARQSLPPTISDPVAFTSAPDVKKDLKRKSDEQQRDGCPSKRSKTSARKERILKPISESRPLPRTGLRIRAHSS